jgi:hypothetical protein
MLYRERLPQCASERRAMSRHAQAAYAESPLPYVRKRTQAAMAGALPNTNREGTIS